MGYTSDVMNHVERQNAAQPEFHQAVKEVLESIEPCLGRHPEYMERRILERLTEPERVIMFRVPWMDDKCEVQVNRGYRIEFNSAIGPYKGGLRFHASAALRGVRVGGDRSAINADIHPALSIALTFARDS